MKTAALVFFISCITFFLGWLLAKWNDTQEQLRHCENCDWLSKQFDDAVPSITATLVPDDGSLSVLLGTFSASGLNDVDIEGLILTESGGNPNAVGDNGRSKGLGQIGRAAWKDTCDWLKFGNKYPYDKYVLNSDINRLIMTGYVNHVIPEKYFKWWNVFDSTDARIVAYKRGPGAWYQGYRDHGKDWRKHLPERVMRDLVKYHTFVKNKKVNV